MKYLQTFQNSIGVLLIVGLVMATFVATVGLSPIAVSTGQTAGISVDDSGQILSNFVPLQISDLNQSSTDFQTQLIKVNDSAFRYAVTVNNGVTGFVQKPILNVQNLNNAEVTITASVDLVTTVVSFVNVSLGTPSSRQVLHTANDNRNHNFQIKIPAQDSIELTLGLEYLQQVNFGHSLQLVITY